MDPTDFQRLYNEWEGSTALKHFFQPLVEATGIDKVSDAIMSEHPTLLTWCR